MRFLLSLLMLVVGVGLGYTLHDRVQCEIESCEVTLTVEVEREPEYLSQADAYEASLLIRSDGDHPAGWCSLPSEVARAEPRFYLEANDMQRVEALLRPEVATESGEADSFPIVLTCDNVEEDQYDVGEEGDL